ncbi:MAG: MmgE/PrpD family protein [Alphaproteobacteria bacterium]|nr:MmgE/PrpD family protein [Alphaproteobacteria bacterium]
MCLASRDMEYAKAIFDFAAEQGGPPEAAAFGTGARMPASWAALYNGSLAHGNDYDDTHSKSIVHIGGAVVPTALAVGEKAGRGGKDVLAAIVAGYEVVARIGMAASKGFHAQGFHPTGVCGAFSASTVAGKLLGLAPVQLAHALGIAGSQASGSMEFLGEGAWTKRMHPGWAAHAGVVAAGLARRGYTGPRRIFEGRYSLYNLYANTVTPDLSKATAGLKEEWEILNTDYKPYPCGHISHPYMDCALKLRREQGVKPEDIESIELRVPTAGVAILCEPAEDKRRPRNSYAARFSLPYSVGAVLVWGKAEIEEFSDSKIGDPAVLALCDRTRYVVDDTLPFPQSFPGWLFITLKGGRRLEARMDASRGSRENPMSDADVYGKFEGNASRALPAAQVRRLWDEGMRLESSADLKGFTQQLAIQ